MRIGVDVGGTHTDAVLMDGQRLLAATKEPTSADIATGVLAAVREVLSQAGMEPSRVQLLTLGTTQLTNAVVERRELEPVAALRLGAQSSAVLPIAAKWPAELHRVALGATAMVDGGHDYSGEPIVPLDEAALIAAIDTALERGLRAFAVSGVFATAAPEAEQRAAALILDRAPDARISVSHQLGRIGLYQRENANLLNATLLRHAGRVFTAFEMAFAELKLRCPLFISQNDGTLMTADYARRFPVLTFSSGPTNSMRGAAWLSGLTDAMVVDVGGTTSDFGMLQAGFPRPSGSAVSVGGVLTNFRMPDVVALGIGGGSIVAPDGSAVGPASVGHALTEQGRVFGGPVLTATDVAVAAGRLELGAKAQVASLAPSLIEAVQATLRERFETTLDQLKTSAAELPLIVVGGGGFLVPDVLAGISVIHRPQHGDVANAIGAALAQVSGEADRVVRRGIDDRLGVLDAVQAQARERAVQAGAAADSVKIVEIDEVPMSYLAEPASVVHVRAVGDVDLARLAQEGAGVAGMAGVSDADYSS